ncbi:diguanylate phosphodiesterase [Photobacterium jeanii]|uniref:Diguanylate phosphodiesterase n=2 Tax=Photobacterium jeanii TaxID=858640 RepID=A0A178K8C3_9GAMM|nr:diguanylate phosphodiesterase [Photobacterium jeanii]PST89416.1 EAL domain-containing protein [Photobacterium jeanii]
MNVRNWLSSFVILILCGLLATFCSGYVSKLYLRHTINSDAEAMLGIYSKQIETYERKLAEFSNLFLYDCGPLDQYQLENLAYKDYFIRRLSLKTRTGKTCTSFAGANGERTLSPLLPFLTPNTSLWVTNSAGNDQSLLVVQREDERGALFVHMEPLITDSLRNNYCRECVLTAISADSNPTVAFWRGDAALFSQLLLFKYEVDKGLNIRVYVSDKLLQKYRLQILPVLFFVGVALGLVMIVAIRLSEFRKLSLHTLVERGIQNREFIPYYQPIVDVSSNSLYGCEMLARWKRRGQGLISPMEFIPYVEKSGQILPITDQLIEKTVAEIGKLNWGETQQVISVNVVPDQLEQLETLESSLKLIHQSRLQPSQIAFEVTERKRFTNLAMASQVIEMLRCQGIDVKLDDAGTGYGGFSYIQQLNIRSLKIDKMFVETIGTTDLKLSLLDSIIAFGRKANMEMIAEGVETQEQSQYLAEHGVTLQQGFYFGRPMPFRDFAYYCKSIVSRKPLTERFQIPEAVLYDR